MWDLGILWGKWECHAGYGSLTWDVAVPWGKWQSHGACGSAMRRVGAPHRRWESHGACGSACGGWEPQAVTWLLNHTSLAFKFSHILWLWGVRSSM